MKSLNRLLLHISRQIDESPGFALAIISGLILWGYAHIYLSFLPDARGMLGHDWSLGLPALLNGYFWMLNNSLLEVPWFTPAKCGGFTFFASEGFYSAASVLTALVSPLHAVRIAFMLFAALGFLGFFALAQQRFSMSRSASLLSATLFLFNGFFGHRMIVGHFGFHAYMLVPLIAWICLRSDRSRMALLVSISLIGLMFAAMVHAPMLQILPPVILSLMSILLLHGLRQGWSFQPWLLLGVGGLWGVGLSLSKLMAFQGLMSNFPRTYYTLPGIADGMRLLEGAFKSLFWTPSETAMAAMVNNQFTMARHEWEYSLGPVPLLIFGAWATTKILRVIPNSPVEISVHKKKHPPKAGWFAIFLLGLLPTLLNWYSPDWNHLLKQLPYFDTTSNLIRWFIIDIPLIALGSGFLMDQWLSLSGPGIRASAATAGIMGTFLFNLCVDRTYYHQGYNPQKIESAWTEAQASGKVVPIREVVLAYTGAQGSPNDGLVDGQSAMSCYEPTLGYRLEKFPVKSLHPGPIWTQEANETNLKNPACYNFPESNYCQPGDHFSLAEREKMLAMSRYQPFAFEMPQRQHWANRISYGLLGFNLFILLAALGSNFLEKLPVSRRH